MPTKAALCDRMPTKGGCRSIAPPRLSLKLLGIRQIAVLVNKMDLQGYSQEAI